MASGEQFLCQMGLRPPPVLGRYAPHRSFWQLLVFRFGGEPGWHLTRIDDFLFIARDLMDDRAPPKIWLIDAVGHAIEMRRSDVHSVYVTRGGHSVPCVDIDDLVVEHKNTSANKLIAAQLRASQENP